MSSRQQAQALAMAVASEVRRALKESFPGVNFSVHHLGFADGRTWVPVSWPASGPGEEAVHAVCRPFESRVHLSYDQSRPLTEDERAQKDETHRVSHMSYKQVYALFDETMAKMSVASGEDYTRLQVLIPVYNRRLRWLRRNEVIRAFIQAHGHKPATNSELWQWKYDTDA